MESWAIEITENGEFLPELFETRKEAENHPVVFHKIRGRAVPVQTAKQVAKEFGLQFVSVVTRQN
ncbi:MAG TPA: hypothetical protein VK612_07215 [Pyrinomonadaceae bacterium]|nr:hypothetical protein [Pyrinomonadaceae bacterium]